MSNDLDSILSGGGASASATETNEQQEQVTQAEGESQQQTEATTQEGESGGQKMVPHEALHAEKQKVKRYTEEVSEFRRTNEALQRQVAELLQRVPVPQKAEQPKVDPVDRVLSDPQGLVRDEVTPHFDQISRQLLANAQLIAGIKYGDDKVAEAEQAFIGAMQSGKLDQADYQKVVSSPNRYAAAVQWHQRQQAQAEIGDDPVAYRAKIEAEILAKHGINPDGQPAAQQQQRPAPVIPSNLAGARNVGARSGPVWSGPASLQDIFKR